MTQRPIFYLKDYKQTPYLIPRIDLAFYLDTVNTKVVSTLYIELRDKNISGELPKLILDGEDFKLLSLKINNIELNNNEYQTNEKQLILSNITQTSFKLEITTLINPSKNKQLMGLYVSGNVFCTQCEAEGFRRITYFYDRPDILAIYSVYIEADKAEYPILLSNGNIIESCDLANNKHFAKWHDPFPKPCYLFALIAGDLEPITDNFTTMSGNKARLTIYTERGKSSRSIYAMDALKRAMAWDEKKFGREYDLNLFNIVAVSDFNMGAMENKGLNIFNDKYVLCDKDTATDADFAGVEHVIAHEYFHNWTGNRITCRDWFQLCLKEGLTVYRHQEFCSDERSAFIQRITDVRLLIASQFSVDKSPLSHPVRPQQYSEINNFYTSTIYEKGAEIIRMLNTIFGKKIFRQAMDLYFDSFDGQACTMEDFIKCFEEVSGKDLTQFMLWYSQSGTPHVIADIKFLNNKLTIKFTQTLEQGQNIELLKPMFITIKYGLINKKGEEIKNGLFLLRDKEQILTIENLAEQPFISLNRNFSAPITIEATSQNSDIDIFLAKYEKDAVNRFMILHKLITKELKLLITNGVENYTPDHELIDILKNIALDESLEPSLRALYLSIPSEREIAQNFEQNRDPIAISQARIYFIKLISQKNGKIFEKLLQQYKPEGEYSPNAVEAGNRSLFLTALLYSSLYKNSCSEIINQYKKADNLTIRFASLVYLTNYFYNAPQTTELLNDFYNLYHDTPLVLDKWFALQASINQENVLNIVKNLVQHKKFDLNNPNRIYALLGSFAFNNLVAFNDINGEGYNFISDIILQIDQHNSQIAARLLSAFSDWKKYNSQRQSNAKLALEKIAGQENISNDIADLVTRILK